jgi:effector-binding domain-containing protein
MHRALPAKIGKTIMGQFTVIIHSEMCEDNNLDMEIGFVLQADFDNTVTISEIYDMTVSELPAFENMLTVARVGFPSFGHGSYAALGMWMDANGYRFIGQGREVYFQFPFPGKEAETVTEIQFPVTKVDADLSLS